MNFFLKRRKRNVSFHRITIKFFFCIFMEKMKIMMMMMMTTMMMTKKTTIADIIIDIMSILKIYQ